MKEIFISKFKNYSSTKSETVSLLDWLKDDSNKDEVLYIRTLNDKDDVLRLKSFLPCVTPSGLFSKRTSNGLIKHSGYICIDIDGKDNPAIIDFEKLKNKLSMIANVAYAGLSVSGKGVFCLIPIKYPEKHKMHFDALKICFESLEIIIDKGCGDVVRLRGYSYDANAYFNEDAVVFEKYLEYNKDSRNLPKDILRNDFDIYMPSNSGNTTKTKVSAIISQSNLNHIDITENYEQWFQIGCALAHEFGEEGRELFHLVSENHPKYDVEVNDRKFSECLENPYSYTIGTFFHWAEQYGLK